MSRGARGQSSSDIMTETRHNSFEQDGRFMADKYGGFLFKKKKVRHVSVPDST